MQDLFSRDVGCICSICLWLCERWGHFEWPLTSLSGTLSTWSCFNILGRPCSLEMAANFIDAFPFSSSSPTYLLKMSCKNISVHYFTVHHFRLFPVPKITWVSHLYFFCSDWPRNWLVHKPSLQMVEVFGYIQCCLNPGLTDTCVMFPASLTPV